MAAMSPLRQRMIEDMAIRLSIIRMSFQKIVCSYCSTLDPKLDPFESRPPKCALREATAA